MPADLQTVVDRWKSGAAGGSQRYIEGVQNTSVDPTQRAIANQQGMLQGVTEAVTSGRWAAALSRVGKAGWQAATVAKASNWSTGVSASGDKYAQAMQTWLPRINSTAAAAKQMPGQTIDQRLARATYFARTLYDAKRGQ